MRPVCEGVCRRPDRTTTSDGEPVAASERTALVSAPYDDDDREGGSESIYAFGAPARTSPGDVNCDIDFFDIDPFVLALFNRAGYRSAYPDCDVGSGDEQW